MNIAETIDAAIEKFGAEHQCVIAVEEASELIHALTKFYRKRIGEDLVVEEVADMLVMCWQLRKIFGADKVDTIVAMKLKRLEERLRT